MAVPKETAILLDAPAHCIFIPKHRISLLRSLPANLKYFSSLDIPSIPQIITLIKLKAVTEESRLAEAARDA